MITIKSLKENFEYPDAKVVEYKDQDIFVKQYLPASAKNQVLQTMIMFLDLDTKPYNPVLAETLFDVNVVEAYSNIIIENDDYTDFYKTYDMLHCEGLINLVIDNIPIEEYEEMVRLYEEGVAAVQQYSSSLGKAIFKIFAELPELLTIVGQEIDNFDPKQSELIMNVIKKFADEKHI